MLTLETFKLDWDKQFPDVRLRRSHFVLAVSGGVDSIVLAHLMQSLHTKCTIAHVNFQLRGDESKRDEQFVRDFASQYNIPIQVQLVETQKYADTYKMGIQEAAREIRYAWFGALMQEIAAAENKREETEKLNALSPQPKPVVLLTAHHANDQAETILMQLFRGTGLHGLTGIPMRRKDILNIARPLLNFTKEEIKAYASANGLSYVEDSSNEKDDYRRNFIRNTILPQVEEMYPNANENILATAQRVKEAEQIVTATVNAFWKKGMKLKKGILSISIKHWLKVIENKTYTWGLIKDFGFNAAQIDEVHKILTASNGAMIASETHQFIKWDNQVQIVNKQEGGVYMVIENQSAFIETKFGKLSFELVENINLETISKDPNTAYLQASKITWPLLLRTWSNSDYFYPLGLGKKKKLNHFLSNFKLSPIQKNRVTVLCIGDKIAWVVGKRIDDRFKIMANTPLTLQITWQEKP
jgi:tRNA(Ile)-lysidine synthase